jgi:hypothetical protein
VPIKRNTARSISAILNILITILLFLTKPLTEAGLEIQRTQRGHRERNYIQAYVFLCVSVVHVSFLNSLLKCALGNAVGRARRPLFVYLRPGLVLSRRAWNSCADQEKHGQKHQRDSEYSHHHSPFLKGPLTEAGLRMQGWKLLRARRIRPRRGINLSHSRGSPQEESSSGFRGRDGRREKADYQTRVRC